MGVMHPIVLPPMAGVGNGQLAAHVSKSGGLGFLPAGYGSEEDLVKEWNKAKQITLNPLGIGFITWLLDSSNHVNYMKILKTLQPEAVWFSFGNPSKYMAYLREHCPNTKIYLQVNTVEEARQAADLGCDVVVVQGIEAGGHAAGKAGSVFVLLPEIADEVGDRVILLAAGGITDGRHLAACLNLGASGVVVGTRFLASVEARESVPGAKKAIIEAKDGGISTSQSRLYDVLRNKPWPSQYPIRTLNNRALYDESRGTTQSARSTWQQQYDQGHLTFVTAGMGVGLVRGIWKVDLIITRMIEKALDCMRVASHVFEGPGSKL